MNRNLRGARLYALIVIVLAMVVGTAWYIGFSSNSRSSTPVTFSRARTLAWSVVPGPSTALGNINSLNSVACTSASSCVAVGSYYGSGTTSTSTTLAELWNGITWSIVPSPDEGSGSNSLNSVACTSASSCVAVGSYYGSGTTSTSTTLAELWNGITWSIVPSPDEGSGSNSLNSVACTSASSCVAVGSYDSAGVGTSTNLAESWNGITWSIVPSPDQGWVLKSVACTSASSCVAVGSSGGATVETSSGRVESWNGITWSIVPSPNPGPGYLAAVTCPSEAACFAVGSALFSTLVESWNGITWSIVPCPDQGSGSNSLNSVACTSASSCVAVGHSTGATGNSSTLVESWNGITWSIVPSPNEGTSPNAFDSVACTSGASCTSVGSSYYSTLVESWNGSAWSIVPSPSLGLGVDMPDSVACTSASSCVAVGDYAGASGASSTLVESWNGITWSIVPSPNTGPGILSSVACPSVSRCVAVGSSGNGSPDGASSTLVESWNGITWSIVPSPNTGPGILSSVACPSVSRCVAVGSSGNGSPDGASSTLVESWNGITWSIVPSPNTGPGILSSVACPSVSRCVAVGSSGNGSPGGTTHTLVESWNGITWSIVPSPNTGPGILSSVACPSVSRCVAVGSSGNGSPGGTTHTLVESWNGITWSIVPSPNTGPGILSSVACPSVSRCVAVGSSGNGSPGGTHTLVESWNGSAWSIVPSPNPGSVSNSLFGVACSSVTACTAVGYDKSASGGETLMESYGPVGVTAHPAATPTGGIWPAPSTDVFFYVDTVAGGEGAVKPAILCAQTNLFVHGEEVGFRVAASDTRTGKTVTPRDVRSFYVEIPGGSKVPLTFTSLGKAPTPIVWAWVGRWIVPVGYPVGIVDFRVVLQLKTMAKLVYWSQPPIGFAQLTIVPPGSPT